jgi:hypothetical protein
VQLDAVSAGDRNRVMNFDGRNLFPYVTTSRRAGGPVGAVDATSVLISVIADVTN